MIQAVEAQLFSSIFQLSENIGIHAVIPMKAHLTVQATCLLTSAVCPLCDVSSERIHDSYERTVGDVPCGGRQVTLALTVRKFVCGTPGCPRKIFTERLPDVVEPYARMTNRLNDLLLTIGFATCGELGERLAPTLGIQASGPTILRRMRSLSIPAPTSVSILGIDDWAWKKGLTYGTLLVDLERRKPIELLADRTASTAEAWLRTHPEVCLISRDRGGEYAAAARKGAPQAQQIADRFHLLKNVRERLKEVMDRKQSCLPEVEEHIYDVIPLTAQALENTRAEQGTSAQEKRYRTISASPVQRSGAMKYAASQKQARREKRIARDEAVRALCEQGMSQRAIARHLKLSRKTVKKCVQPEGYSEMSPLKQGKRKSILDPHKDYVLQRWQQGCRNSAQLSEEIKARGYVGSAPLLRIFLAALRKKQQEEKNSVFETSPQAVKMPETLPPKPRIFHRMSSTRASWLFISQPAKLREREKQDIEKIRAGHSDLERAYQLSQDFVLMFAEHREADLDPWLTQAAHSGLPEFQKMANGIRLDYAAVQAALSSEWSNGQVEAQVNCLKLQKRIVFGRANFDLLRLRVLHRI